MTNQLASEHAAQHVMLSLGRPSRLSSDPPCHTLQHSLLAGVVCLHTCESAPLPLVTRVIQEWVVQAATAGSGVVVVLFATFTAFALGVLLKGMVHSAKPLARLTNTKCRCNRQSWVAGCMLCVPDAAVLRHASNILCLWLAIYSLWY